MTPTERLQAKWPGFKIRIYDHGVYGWYWMAIDSRMGYCVAWDKHVGGVMAGHGTEADACAAADRALKAIRKAVTE